MFDLLICNATIIDGTGAPGWAGDVAVENGMIAEIAPSISAEAREVVDAKGHVLCPGFIDAHGHSDFTLFINHRGESKIRQGITTEVTGNCGFTAGPITPDHEEDLVYYLANTIVLTDQRRAAWKWETQDQFLQHSAQNGLSFNVVPLVGQGMIHVGVMGFETRMPTEAELDRMKAMLQKELDAGFYGMSMAFEYEPGNHLPMEETVALCRLLRERGCIFSIHMKNEGANLLECVEHALQIAEQSGCRVEISHLKARYTANWGKAREAMRRIEAARERGIDVVFDVYPYAAYGSGLIDLIPPWVKKDGPQLMCQRLQDPELRRKALFDMENGLPGWDSMLTSPDWAACVQIATLRSAENKWMEGLRLSQIAQRRNCTPYELVVDLMVEESASVKCIWFAMDEDEVKDIMRHPLAIFGTDGRACATYGELGKGAVHPRYYGTYPRILGKYVREEGLMTLEEAIHKATSAVAQRFGIERRGELKKGFAADLVLFNPETIAETNSFENPHSYPDGIDLVVVNGQIVVAHGIHTGQLPGEILRKRKA